MIEHNFVYIDLTSEEKHLCWLCSELTSSLHSLGFRRQYTIHMYRIFTNLQYGSFIYAYHITDLKKFYNELNYISVDIAERYGELECGAESLKKLEGIIDKIDKEFEK